MKKDSGSGYRTPPRPRSSAPSTAEFIKNTDEPEQRFKVLAESIPGVIYICEKSERYPIIYTNPYIAELTGYSKAEFEQRNVFLGDLIHPEDKERLDREVEEGIRNNGRFNVIYRLKGGEGDWRWVSEIGVARNTGESQIFLEGFITDITNLKETETAYQRSEVKFKTIVEKSNDAIYVISGKSFLMVNKKFEELFGYTQQEVLTGNFTFIDLLDEDSIPIIEHRRRQRERGEAISDRIAFVGKTKAGKKINLEASLSTIEWDGEQAVLGVLRDFTVQKQLEDQLRHSQKIEAVGRLAGGLAHDFNNILTAISGYAELISSKIGDNDPLKDNIGEILSASDRATKLVQQLLAFSRRQVIQPIPVILNDIIRSMDSLLRRMVGEGIEIASYLDESLGTIEIDPALVEQVMMNLAINSRDAMGSGGMLTIETFNTELSTEYSEMHTDVIPGRYVALAISDTGSGISKEIMSQIYEPFFTTKEKGKGTGLGLSTVYGIVKQSGGHIWCYSEVNRGTTFKIYIPRIDVPVKEIVQQVTVQNNNLPRGSETVLIAEDEDSVRKLCSSVLADLGYNILQAKDGLEGLRISDGYEHRIDLLVADVMMPGLNGKELVENALKQRPGIKVIFISGYTNNVILDRGILGPGVEFLQKPFTHKTLANRVRDILDGMNTTAGTGG